MLVRPTRQNNPRAASRKLLVRVSATYFNIFDVFIVSLDIGIRFCTNDNFLINLGIGLLPDNSSLM